MDEDSIGTLIAQALISVILAVPFGIISGVLLSLVFHWDVGTAVIAGVSGAVAASLLRLAERFWRHLRT